MSIFRKSVVLIKGSVLSQVVAFSFLPILSRLYLPEDFGVLASFFSIVGVLVILSTCKYESAILLVKSKRELLALMRLMLIFIGLFFIISTVSVHLSYEIMGDYLNFGNQELYYIMPISVAISAMFLIVTNLSNKNAMYSKMSNSRVVQSAFSNVTSSLGHFLFESLGLIVGRLVGLLAGSIFLRRTISKIKIFSPHFLIKDIFFVFYKYINFLKYSTVSSVLNILSNYSLTLLIALFFDYKVAGLYFMATKIIRIPISLVVGSVAKVFHKEAVLAFQNKENLLLIVKDTQKKIFISLLFLMLVVSIISPYFFELILGSEWRKAGELVKYFALLVVFRNTISTTLMVLDIMGRQSVMLIFNFMLFTSQIFILYISSNFLTFEITIMWLSIAASLIYFLVNRKMYREITNYENQY